MSSGSSSMTLRKWSTKVCRKYCDHLLYNYDKINNDNDNIKISSSPSSSSHDSRSHHHSSQNNKDIINIQNKDKDSAILSSVVPRGDRSVHDVVTRRTKSVPMKETSSPSSSPTTTTSTTASETVSLSSSSSSSVNMFLLLYSVTRMTLRWIPNELLAYLPSSSFRITTFPVPFPFPVYTSSCVLLTVWNVLNPLLIASCLSYFRILYPWMSWILCVWSVYILKEPLLTILSLALPLWIALAFHFTVYCVLLQCDNRRYWRLQSPVFIPSYTCTSACGSTSTSTTRWSGYCLRCVDCRPVVLYILYPIILAMAIIGADALALG
eukprot:gene2441-4735_t